MLTRLSFIGAVLRSPVLRRIQSGFLLFNVGEWASWFAIVVYAYGRGGAAEAGVVGFVISAPSIIVAPGAAVLGDRWPRVRVLLGSYVVQAMAMGATVVALVAGAAVVAYALATLATTIISLSRPALASLLPEVSRSPDELTAANVASGIAEGAGALVGPLLAGVLLAVGGPALVYLISAGGAAVAAVLLIPVAPVAHVVPDRPSPLGRPEVGTAMRALGRDMRAGAAAVLADHRLRAVFAVLAAAIGLLGALSVFIVIIAIDRLALDASAAGYLAAAMGFGALLGSVLALVLVGRERLGLPLIAATILFGCMVAALGLTEEPIAVVVILVMTGIGWSFVYVAATTLTQRLAGDDVMTRVFGISESVTTGAEAVGGLLVPILIVLFGSGGALLVAGLALPVVALLAAPGFIRADRADPASLRELAIIRAIPMFMPLSAPVLERVIRGAERLIVGANEAIVVEGDPGDRFYVIVSGRAQVWLGGVGGRELEAGESFGEIALVRDVPRTATVRALVSTELLAIDRDLFLAALTGQPRSRALADDRATRLMAGDRSR